MKNLLFFLFSVLLFYPSAAQFDAPDHAQITVPVGPSNNTVALLHKPNNYSADSTHYPLIIYCHGLGMGSATGDLSVIYNNATAGGPAYYINQGQWPSQTTNPVDGLPYKFLVLSPQQTSASGYSYTGSVTGAMLDYIITFMIANYRVDSTRIYLTGLSAGGQGVIDYAGNLNEQINGGVALNVHHQIAAVVPMSANFYSGYINRLADTIYQRRIACLPYGSPQQDNFGDATLAVGARLNVDSSGYVLHTTLNSNTYYGISYTGGHCCWNAVGYNPNVQFAYNNTSYGNVNMYQWMLSNIQRGAITPTKCYAGPDQGTTNNSVTLAGTATPGTGKTISSTTWSQISGPNSGTFSNIHSLTSTFSSLIVGVYSLKLTAVDNVGGTALDTVLININASNVPPTVNAGTDKTITLGQSSIQLTGTATGNSGATISSTVWTQISGPNTATITGSTTLTPTMSAMISGTYVFRLTATDNNSLSAHDDMSLTKTTSCGGVRRYITPGADSGIVLNGNTFIWNQGDTIMIRHGQAFSYIYMYGFRASSSCPLGVSNENGPVTIHRGFDCDSNSYIEYFGRDTANTGTPGITIDQTGYAGSVEINIHSISNNIKVHDMEERNGLYGLWIKNEIKCDTTINYPNAVLNYIEVYNMYIHDMNQEGMYCGSTDPAGTSRTIVCNNVTYKYIPTPLGNIWIHDNIITRTYRSGIQLSGAAIGTNRINNNNISVSGLEFNGTQGANIWTGSMTANTEIDHNTCRNAWLGNIQSYGIDSAYIHDNNTDSAGYLNTSSNPGMPSILVDTRTTYPVGVTTSFYIKNNVTGAGTTTSNIFIAGTHLNQYNTDNVICGNVLTLGGNSVIATASNTIQYTTPCTTPPVSCGCSQVGRKIR